LGKGGALVVKTVLSIQRPVFRKRIAISERTRLLLFRILQYTFFLFFFLSPVHWTLGTAHARDFSVHGKVAAIEEVDPLQIIHQKLKAMQEKGELERHNFELQKKTKAAIERPKPVEGITKAHKNRVFYYDPTYLVQEDIKNHQGQVIHAKGTRINPLETVSLSQGLLFFNGDDANQVTFAKEKLKESPLKLILTKGAPLELSEVLGIPVYFDQAGLLTKKLGIRHVPALVTQSLFSNQDEDKLSSDTPKGELRLRVEEIDLKEKNDDFSKLQKGS
jgi:conjugal transfer pilus assembly protein TraW